MSTQYQVKQVKTNKRGYKVTRTISTDDVEEIKALIGSGNKDYSNAKNNTKTAKKTASTKTAKSSKKGVVIEAEFTEVGSKTKEAVAKPKALPTPKNQVKETKRKKEEKKNQPKETKSTAKKKEELKSNNKTYSTIELKRKLRSMKPYHDKLILGNEVVIKTTRAYGVRPIWDHDDPMRDYSAYTYGFKEKEIIDLAKRKGLVKD